MDFLKKPGTIVSFLVVIGLVLMVVFSPSNNDQNNLENNMNENNQEGLIIETLQEGEGVAVENGQTAVMHYTGTFVDGTKFDSSLDRGEPFPFVLGAGRVIEGWDKGVLGMKVGEKRRLTISPELGYGPNDYGPIPGGSTLIFEVELLDIQ
jgi:FKBP-type peptidyl-prolyl cis-trans isomerase FkpA